MPIITGFSGESPGTIIQFVDSIQETPGVRLVLNDFNPFYCTFADWSPGPLRRASTSSMLADGDTITGSRHANRVIELTLQFKTASPDVAAAALSLLANELGRDNILMVQHESRPTFFRTYRSSDYKLEMLNHDIDFAKQTITLVAEPYGLGLPVIAVDSALVDPDPANGGECLDVNGVIGDVETPLVILLKPDLSVGKLTGTSVIAVRRGGDPTQVEHFIQAEAFSPGIDTALTGVVDPDMSGTNAGGNFLRTTFVSTGMTYRLSGAFPSSPRVDARGTYRVFVRARQFRDVPVGFDPTQITLQGLYNDKPLLNRTGLPVPLLNDNDNGCYLHDLGTFHVPAGPDPVTFGYSSQQMPVDAGDLEIDAARLTGTSRLDIDYLLLLPVDDQFAAITWDSSNWLADGNWAVIDGASDAVYHVLDQVDPDTGLSSVFPADGIPVETPSAHTYRGALPFVSPGPNRVYFLASVFKGVTPGALDADVIGNPPVTVTIMYWPRYLALATA